MTPTTLDEYQTAARRTIPPGGDALLRLAVLALGVAGEAGEVADLIKKHVGHGHALDHTAIVRELGDVLWYVAVLADELGWNLSDVADENIRKLRERYPDGFSAERSRSRKPG